VCGCIQRFKSGVCKRAGVRACIPITRGDTDHFTAGRTRGAFRTRIAAWRLWVGMCSFQHKLFASRIVPAAARCDGQKEETSSSFELARKTRCDGHQGCRCHDQHFDFSVLLLSSSAGIAAGGEGEATGAHPRGCAHHSHAQSAVKTAFACQEAGTCTEKRQLQLDQTLHHHYRCLLLPGAGMNGEEVEGEGRNDGGQRRLGGVVSAVVHEG